MVIYFPESWRGRGRGDGKESGLAGKGVWYGRVEPRHVWGIVEETVRGGRVVEELCRGIFGGKEEGGVGGGAWGPGRREFSEMNNERALLRLRLTSNLAWRKGI